MEDAVKRSSFFAVHSSLYPAHGDILKGMAEADHKILSAEVHGIYILFPTKFYLNSWSNDISLQLKQSMLNASV